MQDDPEMFFCRIRNKKGIGKPKIFTIRKVKNMEQIKKEKRLAALFYLLIFAGLMLFLTCAHPLYIYDADDWTYITNPRAAVPKPFGWNPTRILPEILMPLFAQIGRSCIDPFLQDYIQSLAIAFAVALAGMILLYFWALDRLLQKSYQLKAERYLVLLALLLWHFLPFCVAGEKSQHMFYAENVSCVFYYIIPGLLNAGAALLVLSGYRITQSRNALFTGVLLLGVYLCINSNMYQSFILTSVICAELFYQWVTACKEKQGFWYAVQKVAQKNKIKLAIVCAWFASILLELTGGRARSVSEAENLGLKNALVAFAKSVLRLNKIWLFGTTLVVAAAMAVCCYSMSRKSDEGGEKSY